MTDTTTTDQSPKSPARLQRNWVPEANDDAAAALRVLAARPWLVAGRDDDTIAAVRRNLPAVKDALNRLGWALVTDDREFIRLRKTAPQRAQAFAVGGPSPLAWSWFFLIVAAGESMQRRVSIGQLVAAARAAAAEASLEAPGDISERRAIVTALKLLDARGVIVQLDGEIDGFVHDENAPVLLEVHHTRLLNVIANFAPADPVADPQAFLDMICREPDIGRKIRRRLIDDTAVHISDLDGDEVAWLGRRSRDDLEPLAEAFGLHLERRAEGAAFVAPEGSYRHLKELGPLAFPSPGTVAHAALLLCDHANTIGRTNLPAEGAPGSGWVQLTHDAVESFLTGAAAQQNAGTGGWSRELAEDPTGLLLDAVRDMLGALDIVRHILAPIESTDENPSAGVWWFAPLIGRWERDLEPPVPRKRAARRTQENETFDLTADEQDVETDMP